MAANPVNTSSPVPPAEAQGLSAAAAAERLAADGPNVLDSGHHRSLLAIALDTAGEPMFALLLAAGSLYLVLGNLQEGLTLLGCVLATLGLTLFQEGRTERAIEALRELSSPRALVIRDGQPQRIAGRDVVSGDVMRLNEGDRIPADALLIDSPGLQVDESLLTGEAVPVSKRAAVGEPAPARPGGDDSPHLYASTLVVQGQGLARVTATGPRTEVGRIGKALEDLASEPSPLTLQTRKLVRTLALLAFVLSLLLVLVQGLMRGNWLEALLAGIALAMAILPEEYPVVLTVFPALGAWRLSRSGVLTRRLTAIETLGATSVLCSDKTGTLTQNRMTVTRLVAGGTAMDAQIELRDWQANGLPEAFHTLIEYSILASVTDAFDPMEQAFHRLGQQMLSGTEHLHREWQLVQAYALTPQLRAMSHVWRAPDGGAQVVAAKGAPEAVVDLCHLDETTRAQIATQVDALAAQGLRVLAVARGRFEGKAWPAEEHDFDFDFLGLLGLADPLRNEIPAAVRECQEAGIRVLMITGDYPATALAIAAQAGLSTHPSAGEVLSGDEMDPLSDAQLRERLAHTHVCARIAPAQKLRIVQALKAAGEVVAMTGDGVNDAPALRAAHVGVAMGQRGTDVAREAAAIVLLDDNFASIVRAVRLGRRIFDNLRKSMSYLLAVHVPIAGLALLPVLLGWPSVLFPTHIAFLELVIDPACSLAFENEPAEPDLMNRPPRDTRAPLFNAAMIGQAMLQGLGALALLLLGYGWALQMHDEPTARAVAFVALVASNLALIFANRSNDAPVWRALRTPNATLWTVAGAAVALLLLVTEWPAAATLLRFSALSPGLLAAAFGWGLFSLVWFEAIKAVRRRALRKHNGVS